MAENELWKHTPSDGSAGKPGFDPFAGGYTANDLESLPIGESGKAEWPTPPRGGSAIVSTSLRARGEKT